MVELDGVVLAKGSGCQSILGGQASQIRLIIQGFLRDSSACDMSTALEIPSVAKHNYSETPRLCTVQRIYML
jgi:hypothetical protein